MKFVIAHLYHDLMNLYGDVGNVWCIQKYLTKLGIEVEVQSLTITDQLDFTKYDYVYCGSGTERNQQLALQHLMTYREAFNEYIEYGGYGCFIGNSCELLAKSIDGQPALAIIDADAVPFPKRLIQEVVYKARDIPVIGFQNRANGLVGNLPFLFNTYLKGIGSCQGSNTEGYMIHNFFGTYTLGPMMIRNPLLTQRLLQQLLVDKLNLHSEILIDSIALFAYHRFVDKYVKPSRR